MIRTSLFVIATTLLIAIFVFQDRTQHKVALVLSVTTNDYHTSRDYFDTPTPDVALTLSKLGFEVIESIEPDRATLVARMGEFAASLKKADVGLIYYSGKIAQFSGRSYLIPADMKVNQPWLFETYGVAIDPLLHEMSRKGRHNFVFLNACRLSWSRYDKRCYGLSPVAVGKNILVTHANQPTGNKYPHQKNETVFVKALTSNLLKKNVPINQILRNVYEDVNIATKSEQVPWTENGLDRKFVFNKTKAVPFDRWKSFPPKVASIIPITLDKPDTPGIRLIAQPQKTPEIIENKEQAKVASVERSEPVSVKSEHIQPEPVKASLRMDKKTAIRVLQKKLTGFRCYSGRIDGIWGRFSKRAARKFIRHVKRKGLSTLPDIELYKAVAQYEGPVCGRKCSGDRRKARNGQCKPVIQAELHYIPVIVEDKKAPAKLRVVKAQKRKYVRKASAKRKLKRRKAKRRKANRRKFARLHKKRYRKRTRRYKKRYRKHTRRRYTRRYTRKRSHRARRARTRRSKQFAQYRPRNQYRKNPWAKITD